MQQRHPGTDTPLTTLSTVILSWENADDTIACIQSVVASIDAAGVQDSVIAVVDNGSSQATVTHLTRWLDALGDPRITVILNGHNSGFSAGMNIGIRDCRERGSSDYYWLLNNDLNVDPGAVGAMLASAREDTDTAMWGPTIISSKTGRVECAGGCRYLPAIGYFLQAYSGEESQGIAQRPATTIDYVSGAAMFLKGSFVDRIGGLDESYFLYFEELELARRLLPEEKLAWAKDAYVYHAGGGSSAIAGVERRKTREATLSALRYTGRYHPLYLPTVFLARFIGILARGIRQFDLRLPLAVLSGTGAYVVDRVKNRRK